MDIIENLGPLALGSSLKRLSDQLMQDGIRVYRELGIDFEAKWFPVFYYLRNEGPTTVTDLSRALGVSHPAIIQVAREMIAANLLAVYRDVSDKRKRVLALTSYGKSKAQELEPVWQVIRIVLQELLNEAGSEILNELSGLEKALQKRGFHQRFLDHRGKS